MEELGRLDLVSFVVNGFRHESKLFRIDGKFGFVDFTIDENDDGIFQHKKEQRVLLSDLTLIMKRTKDVFSRSALQEVFKNVIMN